MASVIANGKAKIDQLAAQWTAERAMTLFLAHLLANLPPDLSRRDVIGALALEVLQGQVLRLGEGTGHCHFLSGVSCTPRGA
ncbi:hypothetical protein D3C77_567710 [compost metagenome]